MAKATFTFEQYRALFIPKDAIKICDKASDAVAYIYSNYRPNVSSNHARPCACIFFGKQQKPVARFQYRSDAEREASVRRYFEARQAHAKRLSERRDEAKAFQHTAKIGDIWRTCWGYDQTNVEFFEITEIKGKFAILREIACATDLRTEGGPNERIVPQSGEYLGPRCEGDDRGQPIRRLIQDGRIKIDDVRTAWPWGQREPITGTVIGQSVSRTGFGWGH